MSPGDPSRPQDAVRQAFDFNGSMEGATTYLDLVPARRYAVALLANRERSVLQVRPTIAEIRRIVLEAP